MRDWSVPAVLVAALMALGLRLPGLGARPVHGDEAVHAVKFDELRRTGRYVYDSYEYHGPTLYYLTWPVAWWSGARDFGSLSAATLRLVPALLGTGLILLVLLVRDGLPGPGPVRTYGAGSAALLAAVSPALVYYSRDYIQEMLLAFFAFAAIAAGWRYVRSRRTGWALAAGAALGLMHATKETCVISFGALAVALAVTVAWERRGGGSPPLRAAVRALRPGVLGLGALTAILVSGLFYSGFLTNLRGPLDALAAYGTYLDRAGGAELHVHPWHYYLGKLLYTHAAPGPWWSEGLIVLLAAAAVGWIVLRSRRIGNEQPRTAASREVQPPGAGGGSRETQPRAGSRQFLRFLAAYTVLLAVVYSALPYKTPWCLVQFLQPMTLLAGFGGALLLAAANRRVLRSVLAVLLLAAVVHLGIQARAASSRFAADPRNPYVYAHPVADVANLADWVERLAAVHRDGAAMLVQVVAPNPWPLPWYLRRLERVGYWEQPPEWLEAPVVIVADAERAAGLGAGRQVNAYGLRPGELLWVCVQRELYEAFRARSLADAAGAETARHEAGPPGPK